MTKFACSIPWTGFSNEPDGRAQPCCLFKGYITDENNEPMYVQKYNAYDILNSKFMHNLRQEFREGKKPAGCSTCWTDETNGYDSKRLTYNKIHADYNIDYSKEPEEIQELQLIISNACNLKCRSCTPSHSSQWQQELRLTTGSTGYPMPYGQSADESSKLWNERFDWYKNLKRLEVVGGEPFYVKQWHTIFNELIDHGYSKKIDLTLTTNCTMFYQNLIEKLANNFNSISIGLSIDGIGSVYEYIRHPGKWDVTYENIKKYYQFADVINLQFNITISWLNALQLPDLHNLIRNEFPKFKIWNNLVHYPTHLSIYAIPEKMKTDIDNLYANHNWYEYTDVVKSIISYMYSQSITIDEWELNLQKIYKVDQFRNEKITSSIPYMKEYL